MSEAPFIRRPRRGLFKRSRRDEGLIKDLAIVSQLGFIMAGSIGLSVWAGYKLDAWLQAHGIVLTLFILLGILGGGWTVYRQIQDLYKTGTKKRLKK
ncbi:MAG TPA: AtpZ/AtpI family protein [Deltaproteobacteria bacterium]|nr:AtpZ/AtpI family protein [Deltaproteobacteria bacterium]